MLQTTYMETGMYRVSGYKTYCYAVVQHASAGHTEVQRLRDKGVRDLQKLLIQRPKVQY